MNIYNHIRSLVPFQYHPAVEIISQNEDLSGRVKDIKRAGQSLGFVPTMGALHRGHISLLERSVKENDFTIASIFVNPLQFNNSDDLDKYPRDLKNDLKKLKDAGCDLVFTPDSNEFYREKPIIEIDFGHLGNVLEGKHRPGHFNGVAIVVSRLLHLSQPDRSYFGLKDLQQFHIIRRLCLDLGLNTEVVPCEIIRENDGLAMSSRNLRLSEKDRKKAVEISESLFLLKDHLKLGHSFESGIKEVHKRGLLDKPFKVEYLQLIELPSFQLNPHLNKGREYAICAAVEIGGIRLIDNVRFRL